MSLWQSLKLLLSEWLNGEDPEVESSLPVPSHSTGGTSFYSCPPSSSLLLSAEARNSSKLKLIDENGVFNEEGLTNFVKEVKLSDQGPYAVVSIMGPQSSGKSTLLNHLFHTEFRVMNAAEGRNQTTQGVWLSHAVDSKPFTLVMDLEGSDGSERGEDDTNFEKQIALFALAVSHIVVINLWYTDIGREQAACKPLLRRVFEVMMRLFSPRKTTLLFVIRNMSKKATLKVLEKQLHNDILQIWNSVEKHPNHQKTLLSEVLKVEVTALSDYEEREELFKDEVSVLIERFFNSTVSDGLAGYIREDFPASGFISKLIEIWKMIKENRVLNLPALKVMVANFICEAIAKEKIDQLTADEGWQTLKKQVQVGLVEKFGKKLSSILDKYLKSYDREVLNYEESARSSKREMLLKLVYPAYKDMLLHLHTKVLFRFIEELEEAVKNGGVSKTAVQNCKKRCMKKFDKGCVDAKVQQGNWDSADIREKLQKDIDIHASRKLLELENEPEVKNEPEVENEPEKKPWRKILSDAAVPTAIGVTGTCGILVAILASTAVFPVAVLPVGIAVTTAAAGIIGKARYRSWRHSCSCGKA